MLVRFGPECFITTFVEKVWIKRWRFKIKWRNLQQLLISFKILLLGSEMKIDKLRNSNQPTSFILYSNLKVLGVKILNCKSKMLWSFIIAKIRFPLDWKLELHHSLWWMEQPFSEGNTKIWRRLNRKHFKFTLVTNWAWINFHLVSASNYIISGSTGFESAKACAVIEDSPRENVLDDSSYFTNSPVSVKPGKSKNLYH